MPIISKVEQCLGRRNLAFHARPFVLAPVRGFQFYLFYFDFGFLVTFGLSFPGGAEIQAAIMSAEGCLASISRILAVGTAKFSGADVLGCAIGTTPLPFHLILGISQNIAKNSGNFVEALLIVFF